MDLHTSGHRQGVVCAPHRAAVEAGRAVLAESGNAIEAMVAMAATIAAVYPHMNHVGGDGFWLMREPSGRVRALLAAGRAGRDARRELYRDFEEIPARGPLAALTVPGAIAGWALALEAAKAHGGRLPLGELFAHAIRHASEGYVVTRSQARLSADKLGELKDVPGLPQRFPGRGQPAGGPKGAQAPAARAPARPPPPAGARGFLPGRRRPRARRRSRSRRQPGDARRPRALPRHAGRAALGRARG